ncbi:zinc-binding alcohol dehydrogenase family protein [Amycolatopsis sp., V23-08]|uniref:Zinc-binding alcohol dehydrogenase family protein n=1 Tax=Amycolatopsis heterodermiae TaxID=3110235 RepID=A0ABU5R405_9PSEU|nr:zinc-binding alcohol dehydrogenase family protein [Amycolatopsis sp., V23-08]MEA5360922.1 zinc-binding alcohol dehydrogenase family protein [Amycolatopsis sp., V23-08]
MTTNTAAWITGRHARLEVGPAAYPSPGTGQIVVRNQAVAINPLDWIIQAAGNLAYRWLRYPTVLGSDVAGEVVEVGENVTRFRVGDRVLAHAVGTDKDVNNAAEGAFQLYSVVLERLACPIPDALSADEAAVLPLAVSTAACGLFQTDQLGLRHPSANAEPVDETVLVWGGSTSVGSNAVQLAAAAGYWVIATASPRNFDYVTSLGAAEVFDYNSPSVVPDIITALQGRELAGALAVGTTSAAACVRIAGSCTGRRFVSIASPAVSFAGLAHEHGRLEVPRLIFRLITSNVALQIRSRFRRVATKYIFGTTLKTNEVSTAIYRDFLPSALAEGRYAAVPKPLVAGHGIHDLQHAMDIQLKGVSAEKVVVTLS